MTVKRMLQLPKHINAAHSQEQETVLHSGRIVLLGANGSGKSRLGAWIEAALGLDCVRVTAAKSLEIPEALQIFSEERAFNTYQTGDPTPNAANQTSERRSQIKYGDKPTSKTVSDYESILQLLFARHNTAAGETRALVRDEKPVSKETMPISVLEQLKEIWDRVLPHRRLNISTFGTLRCEVVGAAGAVAYPAGQMSDGERVMVYQLGKVLLAPNAATIIIDEPEIHLHPALKNAFWDAIESSKPNSTFVYITHDIGFAVERASATVVWVKSFDGTKWDFETVTESDAVPTELQLTLLGSRKPVLFVEGEKGGFDHRLYAMMYPEFLVWPSGDCGAVISRTRAASEMPSLHHIKPRGMIDRDRRAQDQIDKLRLSNIDAIEVVEVENLFWMPEVVSAMCSLANIPVEETLGKVAIFVLGQLTQDEIGTQIALHVKSQLSTMTIAWSDKNDLTSVKTAHKEFAEISIDQMADQVRERFDTAIRDKDLKALGKIYRRDSLCWRIGECLGFLGNKQDKVYPNRVLLALEAEPSDGAMHKAFKTYLPNL